MVRHESPCGQWVRISKRQARNVYNRIRSGESKDSLALVGDNVNPHHWFQNWRLAYEISESRYWEEDFDTVVADFNFYLALELGRRPMFLLRTA